eukprot:COSAG04_NODE_422_length_14618_cov_11.903712_10_plen_60_part_00
MALRGVVISVIRTTRYQATQGGNTTPPGRRETHSRAAGAVCLVTEVDVSPGFFEGYRRL